METLFKSPIHKTTQLFFSPVHVLTVKLEPDQIRMQGILIAHA